MRFFKMKLDCAFHFGVEFYRDKYEGWFGVYVGKRLIGFEWGD